MNRLESLKCEPHNHHHHQMTIKQQINHINNNQKIVLNAGHCMKSNKNAAKTTLSCSSSSSPSSIPLYKLLSSPESHSRPLILPADSNQASSHILRQKILHRKSASGLTGNGSTRSSRKNNNGFKFHNFVVNQNRSACLEEQHGTKKISVSHWKKSDNDEDEMEESVDQGEVNINGQIALPNPNITQISSPQEFETNAKKSATHHKLQKLKQQHSILESLLMPNEDQQPKKVNKRKPSQVRRVLRPDQSQQVSNQDEPLDLSCKRIKTEKIMNTSVNKARSTGIKKTPCDLHARTNCDNSNYPNDSIQHLIKSVNRSAAQASAIIASVKRPNGNSLHNNNLNPSTSSSTSQMRDHQSTSSKDFLQSRKLQKQKTSQRSIIKKQLEDAFKQNGFLVKTKQVSDANNSAMFCKFRQLRKYTRYYLKSWHHHLPEEVNKLWKGFLPPKTEKPKSSQF